MILSEELRLKIRDAIFSESERDMSFLKVVDLLGQSDGQYDAIIAQLFDHVGHLSGLVQDMNTEFTKNLMLVAKNNSIEIKKFRDKDEIVAEIVRRTNPHPFVLGERVKIVKRKGSSFIICKGELGEEGEIFIDDIKILNQ